MSAHAFVDDSSRGGYLLCGVVLLPAGEPLLWLHDIVAWAVGRGGDWKRRCGEVKPRDIEPWRS